MAQRLETTDGRYRKLADGDWWDTTDIDIVPESVVDGYMLSHRVGIAVIETEEHDPLDEPLSEIATDIGNQPKKASN